MPVARRQASGHERAPLPCRPQASRSGCHHRQGALAAAERPLEKRAVCRQWQDPHRYIGWEGAYFQLDASTGREIKRFEAVKPKEGDMLTAALAYSPDRTKFASSSMGDDEIQLWDLASGAKLQAWKHPPEWRVA